MFQFEEDELRDVPLLVFANKQDLPGAVPASDITEALRLSGTSRPVGVLSVCVTFSYLSDMAPQNCRVADAQDWSGHPPTRSSQTGPEWVDRGGGRICNSLESHLPQVGVKHDRENSLN